MVNQTVQEFERPVSSYPEPLNGGFQAAKRSGNSKHFPGTLIAAPPRFNNLTPKF